MKRCTLVAAAAMGLVTFIAPARAAAENGSSGALFVRGAGYERPQGSAQVRALQHHLRRVGADPGPIDGRYGPLTESAVRRFQRARGLAVDGIVGPRTGPALRARPALAWGAGAGRPHGAGRVRAVQRHLRAAGVDPGPVDGRFGPRTESAVRRFQRTRGLAIDGIIGPRTERRLARIASARARSQRTREAPAAHARAPVAAPARESRREAPDGSDLAEVALLVALATIGIALVVVMGWRRRRRPTPVDPPIAPLGPTPVGLAPAPSGGLSEPSRAGTTGGLPRKVRALGYVTVLAGADVEAASDLQARAIEAACAARGWAFVGGVRERESGNGQALDRPGLAHALERLERGEANCLVVAELRRLTRSAAELGDLLAWLQRAEARLVVLDLGIDSATEDGQLVGSVLATFGDWEHERPAGHARNGSATAPSRAVAVARRPRGASA